MKTFEEYLDEGTAKKQSPDISRANALRKEAETSYTVLSEFIEKIGAKDENANYIIKNAYDIIMEIIRERMLIEGYNTTGKGAHEAEVAYLRRLKCKEMDIAFADQLRYFRNGILYYGKSFDKEYAEKVLDYLKKMYALLKK